MPLFVALSLSNAVQFAPLEAQEAGIEAATETAVPENALTTEDAAKTDAKPEPKVQADASSASAETASGKIATQSGDDGGTVEVEVTPEQDKVIKAFVASREKWSDALVEMKNISIRYANEEDRSPAVKQRYYDLREDARRLMNETYDLAIELLKLRPRDFESGSLIATMLEYRESQSIYENSLEGAKMMIDAELAYPYLYLIAARSAFIEGKMDDALKYYKAFVEVNGAEKLDKCDKLFSSMLEQYPTMLAKEQDQLKIDEKADLPRVEFETSRGRVVIELFEDQAPNTVANFIELTERGFYDGTDFYQVLDNLLAMGGDPVGNGSGTSGKLIPDEYDRPDARQQFRGYLSMAKMPSPRDNNVLLPNTASSQFVIALIPLLKREPNQTVFGRVVEGMETVCSFRRIDPSEKKEKTVQLPPDRIISAKVIRKRKHPYVVQYVQ